MRLALVGFRHVHAMQLHRAATTHPDIRLVGACEEDPPRAAALRAEGKVSLTHERFLDMLDQVECDAVGVGDYYAKRGQLIIEALRRGKHVISDKPICTRMDELEEISRLLIFAPKAPDLRFGVQPSGCSSCATVVSTVLPLDPVRPALRSAASEKRLSVGCLLDLRGSGPMRTARRLMAEGAIGEIHTVNFMAQHPLLWGTRPAWYFEPGKHGGTINDIAIHALDAIPWMTGRKIVEVVAARAWNARLPQAPHFQDAAQLMLRLDNGGGVMGDVSYLAPDGCGYVAPQYWRMTFHGDGGMIECSEGTKSVVVASAADKSVRNVEAEAGAPDIAIESFLRETSGATAELSTADVLSATRIALSIQQAAEHCHSPSSK